MRGAISAHWASTGTNCTRRRRWERPPRATTADRRRANRNCCAAMCACQRIQRGGMFQRIQKGEDRGMKGLIRRPLQDQSSPTPCLAGPQHRWITVTIVLVNVTQVPWLSYLALPSSSCIHLDQYLLVLDHLYCLWCLWQISSLIPPVFARPRQIQFNSI